MRLLGAFLFIHTQKLIQSKVVYAGCELRLTRPKVILATAMGYRFFVAFRVTHIQNPTSQTPPYPHPPFLEWVPLARTEQQWAQIIKNFRITV
jgi:hypothetical protein